MLPPAAVWDECLRVLKPGGHLLAFGRHPHLAPARVRRRGCRVRDARLHRVAVRVGFPKSLDVSKAIDKAAGAEREVVGASVAGDRGRLGQLRRAAYAPQRGRARSQVTAPATDAAREWEGWGTALKPAFEPVVVARKPLIGTVAANVTTHGTGALNIDACRIEGPPRACHGRAPARPSPRRAWPAPWTGADVERRETTSGRWPANVILDEDMAGVLDQQSGTPAKTAHGKPPATVATSGHDRSRAAPARSAATARRRLRRQGRRVPVLLRRQGPEA